jgi:hypothetical protein
VATDASVDVKAHATRKYKLIAESLASPQQPRLGGWQTQRVRIREVAL